MENYEIIEIECLDNNDSSFHVFKNNQEVSNWNTEYSAIIDVRYRDYKDAVVDAGLTPTEI